MSIHLNYVHPGGWAEAAELWTRGAQAVAGPVPQPLGLVHPRAPGMCQWVDLAHEMQELQLDYVTGLMRAATIAREAASTHLEALATTVGYQVDAFARTLGLNGHQ